MKKRFLILLGLCFISFSIFSFEGINKKSSTKDGYSFRLYQIDKSEHPNSFEFYVELTSNNSEEYFVWCFDELNKAMTHFKWLETIEVEYEIELFGSWVSVDKRKSWRKYSNEAEVKNDTYILYWIL